MNSGTLNSDQTPKHKHIKKHIPVRSKVLMISDSLSSLSPKKREKIDLSGKLASDFFTKEGYTILPEEVVADEKDLIQSKIHESIRKENANFIVTIGGTGVSPRDVTIEAVRPLLDKELPGFGELFRLKTYETVGTVALVTRALAGVISKTLIVSLPGSPNAVKLGLDLISREVQHILNHL